MNILKVNTIIILFLLFFSGLFLIHNQNSDFLNCEETKTHEPSVSTYFESIRNNPDELMHFFQKMPKGGDIHIHISGAVHPDDLINISVRHGLFVDPANGQLVDRMTGQPYQYHSENELVPVSYALNNTTLHTDLVRFWSMKDFPFTNQSGHDWFFSTFDLIDPVTYYDGDLIAIIRDRAAEEQSMYLELMTSQTNGDDIRKVTSQINWNDNLSLMRKQAFEAGLAHICERKVKVHSSYDNTSRELSSPDGKNVTVRYNYEALRFYPKKEVFIDLLQAFEIANQSPLIEGITLVGDEADLHSGTDYRLHMEMISYLHSVYPNVSITLHAGELTKELASPEDLRYHIFDAVTTGNANRIGHGVDIQEEENRNLILETMKGKDIPVEILATSNQQILNISGPEHPVSVYLNNDIPIIIATDDPGVEDTNLTQEYVNFTISHPDISYNEIQEINKNSIRYSFLSPDEKKEMMKHLNTNLINFERTFSIDSLHMDNASF